jgi:four helix bundle protein
MTERYKDLQGSHCVAEGDGPGQSPLRRYRVFPKRETYSLTDQIRRASVSIPSNIAEGQGHCSKREFRHFLRHSRGSLAEGDTQVLIAQRWNYRSEAQTAEILRVANEVGRIRSGLLNSLSDWAA